VRERIGGATADGETDNIHKQSIYTTMIDFAEIAREKQAQDEINALREKIMRGELPDEDAQSQVPGEIEATLPARFADAEQQLIEALNFQKDLNAKIDSLKEQLLAAMQENGIKKWQSDSLIITRVFGTTRYTLDSKRLEKEAPEVYAHYRKASTTKDSLKITVKGIKD
jgi:hypothetical protein